MTIASEITRINNNIADAYTAASGKGATLPATQNSANLATCIGTITTGGGGSSGTSDVPLTRVTDDNNNEIGTWFMNFLDGNGNLYKVVLLDAQYRNASTQWCSEKSAVTNMPSYSSINASNVWEAKETATQNTQMILNYCNTGGYTSTACSHCRSKSFTIGGVTYYGQLPNILEETYLAKHYNEFDSMDTSAGSNPSTSFRSARSMWSSSQGGTTTGWYLSGMCTVISGSKSNNNFACPILEIPISTTSKTYYAWWYGSVGLTLYTSEALPTTNSILYEINANVMKIASGIKLVNIASDGSNISIEVSGNTFTLDRYSSGDVSINYTPV